MKTYILLPAYNEAGALPSLLKKIRTKLQTIDHQVVVVDDGSSDKTAEITENYPLVLLRHKVNRGLGVALRTGFDYIVKSASDEDVLVTMDADDTHDPSLILKMTALLSGHDIVIASRYCRGGEQTGVGWVRGVLSRAMSWFMGLALPVKGASDYSSGYRAYRAGILKRGFLEYGDKLLESPGFACMPEILIKLSRIGARVTEVPLVLHYEEKKSASKFNSVKLLGGYLSLFWILLKGKR